MRWLADRLEIEVDPRVWTELVDGASFEGMKAAAAERVPDLLGVLIEPAKFFRRGKPGAGREVLTNSGVAAYERRVRDLVAREDIQDPSGVLQLLNLP